MQGPIVDLAFRDQEHVAVVSKDGVVSVVNYKEEVVVFACASYFASFTCLAWSADGMYLLTGGQDDLVSLFSVPE